MQKNLEYRSDITIPLFSGFTITIALQRTYPVIADEVHKVIYNRLRYKLKREGIIRSEFIQKYYGKSKMMCFLEDTPLVPFSYVQTKTPRYKKVKVCKYTPEGRDESIIAVLHMLAKSHIFGRSIEYMDNRVSIYAAQYGKCAVTGKVL